MFDGAKGKFLAYTILIASSALFASGYILARFISPEAGMDMFVAQTLFFCALTLSIFSRGSARGQVDRASAVAIVFNGVSTPLIVFLVMSGARLVTPSLASILVISNVLMIAALAGALGRKKFKPVQLLALAMGFAGIVWISVMRGNLGGEGTGVLYLLLAACLIASITIAIEGPIGRIGWAPVTRWSFWVGAAVSFAVIMATGGPSFHSIEQSALAVVVGAASLGAPVLMFNAGMSKLGSADAAAFKLLIPFWALIYGAIFINEVPGFGPALAGLVVVGSVALYQFSSGGDVNKMNGLKSAAPFVPAGVINGDGADGE